MHDGGGDMNREIEEIKNEVKIALKQKELLFSEVVDMFKHAAYRDFLLAWSDLKETELLQRTNEGLYYMN